jgi:hypothetical protein
VVLAIATPQRPQAEPRQPVSWTALGVIIASLGLLTAAGYGLYRLGRRRYRAQLAQLEGR